MTDLNPDYRWARTEREKRGGSEGAERERGREEREREKRRERVFSKFGHSDSPSKSVFAEAVYMLGIQSAAFFFLFFCICFFTSISQENISLAIYEA